MFSNINPKALNNVEKKQSVQNLIQNLVKIAFITSVAIVITNFHIPIPLHGIEIDKIDLSGLVYFILFGIVNLKILLISVSLLPLVDNLMHGHNLVLIPFEIIMNNLILIVGYGFWKLANNQKSIVKFFYVFITLCIIFIIKIIYSYLMLKIFTPLFDDDLQNFSKFFFITGIFGLISIIKYVPILFISYSLKRVKWNQK